jgi:hypothetical protein
MLAETEFNALWAEGRSMTMEQLPGDGVVFQADKNERCLRTHQRVVIGQ